MQDDAGAHSRARIGGACSQVAQLIVKGKGHVPGKAIVHPEAFFRRIRQVQSLAHRLYAQVILLIHHDGEGFLLPQKHSRRRGMGHQIPADFPALRQALPLQRR